MISRRSLIAGLAFLHTAARPASLIALQTVASASPVLARGGGGNGNQGFGRRNSTRDNNSKGSFNKSAGVTEADQQPGSYSVSVRGSTVEIRYPNGILERLTNRRFSMTDRRGRTIVDRPATSDDRARIRSLLK